MFLVQKYIWLRFMMNARETENGIETTAMLMSLLFLRWFFVQSDSLFLRRNQGKSLKKRNISLFLRRKLRRKNKDNQWRNEEVINIIKEKVRSFSNQIVKKNKNRSLTWKHLHSLVTSHQKLQNYIAEEKKISKKKKKLIHSEYNFVW